MNKQYWVLDTSDLEKILTDAKIVFADIKDIEQICDYVNAEALLMRQSAAKSDEL